MNDFEKQVIEMLYKVLEKQSEHYIKLDNVTEKINTIEDKINEIMEQTSENAEVKFDVLESKKQLKRLSFEIELIKQIERLKGKEDVFQDECTEETDEECV